MTRVGTLWKRRRTTAPFVLLLFMIAGMVYEPIAQRRERTRYPQIGRSVSIGRRTLNIHCVGEGGPTVVFDTFSHQSGYSWMAIQEQTASFSRSCWYDRPGYGWSEPGPLWRTSEDVATDLHALLQGAGVAPPYILVGNGDVSLQVRVYNRLYPGEVAGAVFVNANDVEDAPITPESHRPLVARYLGRLSPYVGSGFCAVLPAMSRIGLLRMAWMVQRPRRAAGGYGLTPAQEDQAADLSDNPTAYVATATALCIRKTSVTQARAAGALGDRPLIAIAFPDSEDAEANAHWTGTVQPRLAALSTRGRLIVVEPQRMQAAIVEGVRDVVAQVRDMTVQTGAR